MKATKSSKRNFIFCISLYDLLRQKALPLFLFCQVLNIFKVDVNVGKYIQTEAYHLEADNSDPMLGFFSQPIKIYFLIWSY